MFALLRTFRFRLLASFAVLLSTSLAVSVFAHWNVSTSQYLLERSRLAHLVLENYLDLKIDVYVMVKQFADLLLTGSSQNAIDFDQNRLGLDARFAELRRLIANEVAVVDSDDERASEKRELDLLAAIDREVVGITHDFREIRDAYAEGRASDAAQTLRRVLEDRVDGRLAALLAEAIDGELSEVAIADDEAARLLRDLAVVTTLATVIAFTVAALALLVLLRSFSRPMGMLLQGTETLAAGDLAHRLPVVGLHEFTRLAESFNRMASDLERNREALRASRTGLEAQVASRTRELSQANEALGRVDQIRKRFFADISHELRTPLTVIRGEAEIALRGRPKTDEEYRSSLERIVSQSVHLSALVDDLLLIARAEAGASHIKFEAVRLPPLLDAVCTDAARLGASRQIEVTFRGSGQDVVVAGAPLRLRQLFLILLDNAVRYSRQNGAVTVDILTDPRDVVIRIVDDGIGIPPEDIDHIFERFYRGSNVAEGVGEGSGLGLPVAKAIVEVHGGDITVDSRPGEGTTITVTLPRATKLRAIA